MISDENKKAIDVGRDCHRLKKGYTSEGEEEDDTVKRWDKPTQGGETSWVEEGMNCH